MATPMQIKYQRKLRKLRASYRRKMALIFILALLVGAVLGWFANDYLSGSDVTATGGEPEVTASPSPSYPALWQDPRENATDEPEVTPEPTEEATAEPTEEATSEPEATAEPSEEATAEPTEEATSEPTAEPTEEPTPEPTEEPTPEPTPEPVEGSFELPVEIGKAYSFTIEVLADGTPRKSLDEAEYFSVPVTLTVVRNMDSEYYAEAYSDAYMLKGNEAGCELQVSLGDCEGLNELVLQDAVTVVLQNADGEIHPGYQFTNAEISGDTDSLIATGSGATIYKRYVYDAIDSIEYLTVTYYNGGEMQTVYYSLVSPEPEATPEPIVEAEPDTTEAPEVTEEPEEEGESYTIGDTGEGVKLLQQKLIDLGYLTGMPDGQFGQWTASAVKLAQKDFGLEQTGIADAEFLDILYSK